MQSRSTRKDRTSSVANDMGRSEEIQLKISCFAV